MQMKGHVATPSGLADRMVAKLFADCKPESGDQILFPGIGSNAPFVQAVHDWCTEQDVPVPDAVAIELDPSRIEDAEETLAGVDVDVNIQERDFLAAGVPDDLGEFDYVIGNPAVRSSHTTLRRGEGTVRGDVRYCMATVRPLYPVFRAWTRSSG